MSAPDPFLSDDQVQNLTGYVQPKRQARWLAANGIKFFRNARGQIRIPRDAVMSRVVPAKQDRTVPDFTKVRKAS